MDLTAREFRLLEELPGRLLVRLGEADRDSARVVDVHVARVRRKLGPAAAELVTVRGVGCHLDAG